MMPSMADLAKLIAPTRRKRKAPSHKRKTTRKEPPQ